MRLIVLGIVLVMLAVLPGQTLRDKKVEEIDARIADLQAELDSLRALRSTLVSGQLPDSALPVLSISPAGTKTSPVASGIVAGQAEMPVPTPAKINTPLPAAAVATPVAPAASSSGYTSGYIKGPRGGCYKITKNGNKSYVDRSFCR